MVLNRARLGNFIANCQVKEPLKVGQYYLLMMGSSRCISDPDFVALALTVSEKQGKKQKLHKPL